MTEKRTKGPAQTRLDSKMVRRQSYKAPQSIQRARGNDQSVPSRVRVKDLPGEPLLRLARERQHRPQCLKRVADQAESDLLALVRPPYARADQEGRTLMTSALQSAADLGVGKDRLRVRLAPLSSAHRSQAIAALCETLNSREVCFPGTSLRMRYGVIGAPV